VTYARSSPRSALTLALLFPVSFVEREHPELTERQALQETRRRCAEVMVAAAKHPAMAP
jgi:hypothetical protein